MGRVKSAARNIAFGYIGTVVTAIMSFILRTIFIHQLDEVLLGVNGLYTSILSILSMAELGIGTALNFSLYAPVANNDTEKIKSYMQMYRKAYTTIAIVVATIGIALLPFLPVLVKNPGYYTETDLILFYLIFLFNTVSTYFVSYKYSLVNAQQKNYIQTNINTITKVVTVCLQIIVLIVFKNFYMYLLTDAVVQLMQKIFVSRYLNKLYPYLKEKEITPLTKDESGAVWSKTRALVAHKIGDVARLQTDSLIISGFIEVATVGIVDNYNLVISTVSNFVNIIFNSVISGFGNLIATENKQKQYDMFKIYRFSASWFYGFSATGFFVLLSPLIELWLGQGWLLGTSAIYLLLTDYYFKGDRIVLSNYKTAAGVFEQDKYLALIQGLVNLVLSIWLVQVIGLAGIYVGTVVSGLIANITKPFIIYKVCFNKSPVSYFIDSLKYTCSTFFVIALCLIIRQQIMPNVTYVSFAIMFIIVCVSFNVVFMALFGKSNEAKYMFELVKGRLHKRG